MMNVRICKQCGEGKQLTKAFFRPYYGDNVNGFYRVCRECEKINNRYKYIKRLNNPEFQDEINLIESLYETLKAAGYEPPRYGSGNSSEVTDAVNRLLARKLENSSSTPADLQMWLTMELDHDPEHLEDVYFELREKYMPVISIDRLTGDLKYDTTYKEVLDQILSRFNDYEDEYYSR